MEPDGWSTKALNERFPGVKINIPYNIFLAETILFPIELDVVRRLILYTRSVAEINSKSIPVKNNHKVLMRRKGTWNLQCMKWFRDWNI
jgi:hypothetical protein